MDGVETINTGIFAALSGFMSFFYLILVVIMIAAMWGIFAKARQPGWAAIIPIYNYYVLLQVCGKPWWWLLLLLIPFVNIIVIIIVTYELSRVFGHGWGWFFGLWLLPFIFYPMLAWGKSQYLGPQAS